MRVDRAEDTRTLGTHLWSLQLEEAELLANLIAERLTRSALDILKLMGLLEEREEPDVSDMDPAEAELQRRAESVLHRHLKRRR